MMRAIINPVQKNIRQRDLWGNVCRQNNDNGGLLKCAQNKIPKSTLKEALRNRPPVADFINEIRKANKKGKDREKGIDCIMMMLLMIILMKTR